MPPGPAGATWFRLEVDADFGNGANLPTLAVASMFVAGQIVPVWHAERENSAKVGTLCTSDSNRRNSHASAGGCRKPTRLRQTEIRDTDRDREIGLCKRHDSVGYSSSEFFVDLCANVLVRPS